MCFTFTEAVNYMRFEKVNIKPISLIDQLMEHRVKPYMITCLYDLGTDPGELYNIAEEHPDIVQELTMLANAHKASLKIAKSIFDQK